jgi:hypothetical protein
VALLRHLGFAGRSPYDRNPVEATVYLEKRLDEETR